MKKKANKYITRLSILCIVGLLLVPLTSVAQSLCDFDKASLERVLEKCSINFNICQRENRYVYECLQENRKDLKWDIAIGFGMFIDKSEVWEYSPDLARKQFQCYKTECNI